MLFNPDSSKQVQKIVFSWKNRATSHGSILLSNMIRNWENVLKHVSLLLYVRLKFVEHLNEQIKEASKGIILMRKLHPFLQHLSPLTIYKSFV